MYPTLNEEVELVSDDHVVDARVMIRGNKRNISRWKKGYS